MGVAFAGVGAVVVLATMVVTLVRAERDEGDPQ